MSKPTSHTYYYVHVYISDMHWCHLVPLRAAGVFGGTSVRSGRTRYKLVPEGEGRELDVSASICQPVIAFTITKTQDADKETWDIVDDAEAQEYLARLAEERRRARQREMEAAAAAAAGGGGGGGAAGGGDHSDADSTGGAAGGGLVRPGRGRGRAGGGAGSRGGAVPVVRPDWVGGALRAMRRLIRHKHAWPFVEPVDPVALNLPDYTTIVRCPMDFGTVQKRLSRGGYASAGEVARDVALTLDNAILYNPATNSVHQFALELRGLFDREFAREQARWLSRGAGRGSGMARAAAESEGGWSGGEANDSFHGTESLAGSAATPLTPPADDGDPLSPSSSRAAAAAFASPRTPGSRARAGALAVAEAAGAREEAEKEAEEEAEAAAEEAEEAEEAEPGDGTGARAAAGEAAGEEEEQGDGEGTNEVELADDALWPPP